VADTEEDGKARGALMLSICTPPFHRPEASFVKTHLQLPMV